MFYMCFAYIIRMIFLFFQLMQRTASDSIPSMPLNIGEAFIWSKCCSKELVLTLILVAMLFSMRILDSDEKGTLPFCENEEMDIKWLDFVWRYFGIALSRDVFRALSTFFCNHAKSSIIYIWNGPKYVSP